MFEGRRLLIATKHGKEKVIAPIIEAQIRVKCFVSSEFDTDQLGTFTGEIERQKDVLTTLKQKCLLAMEMENCDLAMASEGSFGPHPSLFFIPANDEFLIFNDKLNGLEIIVRELSTDTNFNAAQVDTEKEVFEFAKAIKFPSHGLILRKAKNDFTEIVKGINSEAKLLQNSQYFLRQYGSLYIETDMRALYNPIRMQVIEKVTHKMAQKLNTFCPSCLMPGFGVVKVKPGLPCLLCNYGTNNALSHIFECHKCKYIHELKYPNEQTQADPISCDRCNP